MLAWFKNSQEQLGKWRLCTICENLTTLKHISITENCFAHAVPIDWQEKLNCLTQLKLLESLASKLIPSPACLAALTNLTRLEPYCFYDRNCHLNPVMDIVPSLPRLEALQLGLCPSKRHLQSLSRMPHLTYLVIGHPMGSGRTMQVMYAVFLMCMSFVAWPLSRIWIVSCELAGTLMSTFGHKVRQRIRSIFAFQEQSISSQ